MRFRDLRRRLNGGTWLLTLTCILSTGALVAFAQTDSRSSGERSPGERSPGERRTRAGSERKAGPPKSLPRDTPQREAAVMAFVEQHHPELERLLKHLKLAAPTEYQKAIQELFRTSERLAVIRDRAPQRYRIELQIWQARSRAQLLSARLKMATDPELVNELRTLLAKKIDLELELLERERRRHLERLERIEKQMERKKSTREAVLERQVRMLSHAARNHRGRASGENKKRNSTK